jgi:hypothetical protein
VPLNENEERILQEIEQRFYANDPESAHRIGSTTLPKYLARNCKWAALGFGAGLVVLLIGFASSWIVGVFGFLVMLVSAIVLTHNLRRMGQHATGPQVQRSRRRRRPSPASPLRQRRLVVGLPRGTRLAGAAEAGRGTLPRPGDQLAARSRVAPAGLRLQVGPPAWAR